MRNLAAKVPEDRWPEFKARATACYQAPSRAIARDLAAGVVADFATELATAVRCFTDDFAHLRMPVAHRRAIRTTDEIDTPFIVFREVLKRAPERPPTSLAQARARSLPWYRVSARATAWRRAGLEDGSLAAQPHRRSSFAALVRPAFGRRGCHWLTKCS
jgi:hypothetical protein